MLDEASAGDPDAAAKRINVLGSLPLVPVTDEARSLAGILAAKSAIPAKALLDALHLAVATTNGMEYLLTWNCRRLANATLRARIERTCRDRGLEPPTICTPQELTEVNP